MSTGFVMPPAYVEPSPTPTAYVEPPAYVDPYPTIQLASNPDIYNYPPPYNSDPNPIQAMFMVKNGTAVITTPVIPQPTSLDPPDPTLPVLPPPLPTSPPTLP